MEFVQTKILEVPPVDLGTQQKILNLWITDMQRNGIVILSVKGHTTPGSYLIEYRSEAIETEL